MIDLAEVLAREALIDVAGEGNGPGLLRLNVVHDPRAVAERPEVERAVLGLHLRRLAALRGPQRPLALRRHRRDRGIRRSPRLAGGRRDRREVPGRSEAGAHRCPTIAVAERRVGELPLHEALVPHLVARIGRHGRREHESLLLLLAQDLLRHAAVVEGAAPHVRLPDHADDVGCREGALPLAAAGCAPSKAPAGAAVRRPGGGVQVGWPLHGGPGFAAGDT
mmetsp:Transcript_85990/g.221397  ORF Transcript_85990/g.221397 Transcript_85990/m.221397 type:complete len:222 (+) Transcript_85990:254-919(+)